jgi:hypothetical protein
VGRWSVSAFGTAGRRAADGPSAAPAVTGPQAACATGVRDVAERVGHGVDVLLKVYAKCIDGGTEIADRRIEDALAV